MSHEFNPLKVSKIVSETADAKTIYFDVPAELKSAYQFTPGQYLTLKFEIDGSEQRRSYSLCSCPTDGELAVNVKRVNKGLISNHINNTLKAGDTVEVMTPDGKFIVEADSSKKRDHYFFAAGSGITPIMSMVKTILEEEPKSVCYLLYGNKNEDSIIFDAALKELARKYEGQFYLKQTLSSPNREKEGGLKGLFSRGKVTWTGLTGRINGQKIDQFINENKAQGNESHYYVCGPGAMIDTIIDHLETSGIGKENLHTEHFVSSTSPNEAASGATQSKAIVHLSGKTVTVEVPPEKTILDALIDAKHDAPYSCTSGACSTCVAKISKGKVAMDACYALDDSEVAAGYILTCQSRALTPEVELSFES